MISRMKELKYYGIHACEALWQKRPKDIIRVYVDETQLRAFGPLLKWCAQNKKAYHIVKEEDLNKVTDSVHHEGICILAKELKPLYEEEMVLTEKMCLLYLDGVQNPHNLGSIIRTSAHFGISYILGERLPSLSPSACRIAKGGAEIVRLVSLPYPLDTIRRLKLKGFELIGTSSHKGSSLYEAPFSKRTILAIGSESDGLSKPLLKQVSRSIQIPGTDAVESLNVAVATGVCIGEYCRQHLCPL